MIKYNYFFAFLKIFRFISKIKVVGMYVIKAFKFTNLSYMEIKAAIITFLMEQN